MRDLRRDNVCRRCGKAAKCPNVNTTGRGGRPGEHSSGAPVQTPRPVHKNLACAPAIDTTNTLPGRAPSLDVTSSGLHRQTSQTHDLGSVVRRHKLIVWLSSLDVTNIVWVPSVYITNTLPALRCYTSQTHGR